MKTLLLLNLIIPCVMLLAATMLKKMKTPYPGPYGLVKWKIDFSGYNTPQARKSPAHWDYAQSIAPGNFVKYGKYALGCSVFGIGIGLFLPWYLGFGIGYAAGFLFLICAFAETERALRDRFLS